MNRINLFFSIFIIILTSSKCYLESKKTIEEFLAEQGVKKGLIINADDLGMAVYINRSIMKAWDAGVISSISLQTVEYVKTYNGVHLWEDALDDAVNNINIRDGIDVGCHLTLNSSDGLYARPVLSPAEVPTLVDKNGFFRRGYLHFLFVSRDEVKAECRAQIDRALLYGIKLSHIDCHQGWGHIFPELKEVYAELASEYNLPARWPVNLNDNKLLDRYDLTVPSKKNNHFISLSDYNIRKITVRNIERRKKFFIKKLDNLPDGITEVLCHPAIDVVRGNEWRVVDYLVLTDEEVKDKIRSLIETKKIAMVRYRDLQEL